jgi:two-component sensor histidine kinase/PAS domain-containing protein
LSELSEASLFQSFWKDSDFPFFSLDRDYTYIAFNQKHFQTMQDIYGQCISLGKKLSEFQPKKDWENAKVNLDRALQGEKFTEFGFSGSGPERKYFLVSHCPVYDGSRKEILGVSVFAVDLSSQKSFEEKLRLDADRLERAETSARMGSWEIDFVTGAHWWSKNHYRLLGFPVQDKPPSLEDYLDRIHPEDREKVEEAFHSLVTGREPVPSVFRSNPQYGEIRYFLPTVSLIRDSEGKIIKIEGTTSDIREMKKAETEILRLLDEKEILLKEVHHRIKNNMNTMMALLSLQGDRIQDPVLVDVLNHAKSRLQSMGTLYDLLYRSDNPRESSLRAYLQNLVPKIISIFPNADLVDADIQVDDVILNTKSVYSLGILLNELISNSMKYAFPNHRSKGVRGKISLLFRRSENEFIIVLSDNGDGVTSIPGSSPQTEGGFGMQLVEMLAIQLQAKIQHYNSAGTRYEIRIPLSAELTQV